MTFIDWYKKNYISINTVSLITGVLLIAGVFGVLGVVGGGLAFPSLLACIATVSLLALGGLAIGFVLGSEAVSLSNHIGALFDSQKEEPLPTSSSHELMQPYLKTAEPRYKKDVLFEEVDAELEEEESVVSQPPAVLEVKNTTVATITDLSELSVPTVSFTP